MRDKRLASSVTLPAPCTCSHQWNTAAGRLSCKWGLLRFYSASVRVSNLFHAMSNGTKCGFSHIRRGADAASCPVCPSPSSFIWIGVRVQCSSGKGSRTHEDCEWEIAERARDAVKSKLCDVPQAIFMFGNPLLVQNDVAQVQACLWVSRTRIVSGVFVTLGQQWIFKMRHLDLSALHLQSPFSSHLCQWPMEVHWCAHLLLSQGQLNTQTSSGQKRVSFCELIEPPQLHNSSGISRLGFVGQTGSVVDDLRPVKRFLTSLFPGFKSCCFFLTAMQNTRVYCRKLVRIINLPMWATFADKHAPKQMFTCQDRLGARCVDRGSHGSAPVFSSCEGCLHRVWRHATWARLLITYVGSVCRGMNPLLNPLKSCCFSWNARTNFDIIKNWGHLSL